MEVTDCNVDEKFWIDFLGDEESFGGVRWRFNFLFGFVFVCRLEKKVDDNIKRIGGKLVKDEGGS